MRTLPTDWVLSSGNRGKLDELRELLRPLGVEIRPQNELGVTPAPETGLTFVENALAKARHACGLTGLPAIADDSGLCVDALGGRPGIRSARFAGPDATDAENTQALLEALRGVGAGARGAYFYCAIVALTEPDDPTPWVTTGRWDGRIAERPAGTAGFGYDPIFVPAGGRLTAAAMPAEEKRRQSHRARALGALVDAWSQTPE